MPTKWRRICVVALVSVVLLCVVCGGCGRSTRKTTSVAVLHSFDSDDEQIAAAVLQDSLAEVGIQWSAPPDALEYHALLQQRATIEQSRVPIAVHYTDDAWRDLHALDLLSNLDQYGADSRIQTIIAEGIQAQSQIDTVWRAVPYAIRTHNWIWGNRALLDALHITYPTNWEEFLSALQRAKDAGYIPLAMSGSAQHISMLFETALLAIGGVDFYRRALATNGQAYLRSETMRAVYASFLQLHAFINSNYTVIDNQHAYNLFISQQAAFIIDGSWIRTELLNGGVDINTEIICFQFDHALPAALYTVEQFVFLKTKQESDRIYAQFADALLAPAFQTVYSVLNGTIPARLDISTDMFDSCGEKAIVAFRDAHAHDRVYPSLLQEAHLQQEIAALFNSRSPLSDFIRRFSDSIVYR